MPDGADEAIGVARQPGERAPEHLVGGAIAVNIRRQERADAAVIGVLDDA